MIPIQNIYYMLSYTFQNLNEKGYKSLSTEKFENTAELFSAILIKGLEKQLKQGLGREYIENTEPLSVLRGKIDITNSIRTQTIYKKQLICTFDDFSINSYQNQIIKSTIALLFKSNISKTRKKELKKLYIFFAEVDLIDIHNIKWTFRFDKNNQTYQMLLSICNLIIKGLLQTNSQGETKLMDFIDEQRMCKLYEKFILEYYRKEFPALNVSSPYISWQLDDGADDLLPVMKSDVILQYNNTILIIDAKYYSKTLQSNFNTKKNHSSNLYQMFTYIKNKEIELTGKPHTVSGLLLYAKTDEEIQPNSLYKMSGNTIGVKTLDLNCDFGTIKAQLNNFLVDFKLQ